MCKGMWSQLSCLGPYKNKLLFTDHLLCARHLTSCTLSFLFLFANLRVPYPQAHFMLEDTYPHNNHCEKQYTDHVLPFLL